MVQQPISVVERSLIQLAKAQGAARRLKALDAWFPESAEAVIAGLWDQVDAVAPPRPTRKARRNALVNDQPTYAGGGIAAINAERHTLRTALHQVGQYVDDPEYAKLITPVGGDGSGSIKLIETIRHSIAEVREELVNNPPVPPPRRHATPHRAGPVDRTSTERGPANRSTSSATGPKARPKR